MAWRDWREFRTILLGSVVVALSTAVALAAHAQEAPGDAARRSEYFDLQRRLPNGQLAIRPRRRDLVASLASPAAFFGPNTYGSWTAMGPSPLGVDAGRVSALAIHPTTPSTIYVGGAQGGLWKSTNSGSSWTPLTDNECSLAIGAVTLDPANPNIVYVGTGEANFSADSWYGCGILKSTDGGTSWTTLGSAIWDSNTGGSYISKILIPPGQTAPSSTIFAATSRGLYRSTDGGVSWVQNFQGYVTDVVSAPNDPTTIYAALGNGASPGVYRSTDGGLTFALMAGGLPTANVGRTVLAVTPAEPNAVFAAINNTATSNLLGLYKSTDKGLTWTSKAATGVQCASQCWYALYIAVDPTNAATVYVGAFSLYKSVDGGDTFVQSASSVHVDHHAFAFDPITPTTLYDGNDGGVYRSTNAAASWTNLNANLNITQFYPGVSSSAATLSLMLGGTQDNGTARYTGSTAWGQELGGDGGFTAVNPGNSALRFAETQWIASSGYSGPRRSTSGYNLITTGINLAENGLFIPPLMMDEARPNRLFFGIASLYRTSNNGDSWTRLNTTSAGVVSAIGIAASDSATYYVAHSNGTMWVTHDDGATFTQSTVGLPTRYFTSITVHRSNAQIAYATTSSWLAGHVFKTINGGQSWTNITGNLPDNPVNRVLLLPDGALVVGTDLGVYLSANDGTTWSPYTGGLPNVAVLDLHYHVASSTMVAATHGRGMWSSPIGLVASATHLAVDRTPTSVIAGLTLSPTPQVSVRTAGGDRKSDATNAVTVALNIISGTGALTGTTTVNAVAGVATFADLKISASGSYTLTYTAAGLSSVTSPTITVLPPPTQLAVTTQPAGAVSGVPFTTQPVVELRDANGAAVAQSGVVVTVAKASGTGTLGGTLTATTNTSGRATFTNLAITGAGAHTLTFTATGLTAATSASFTVGTAPASQLAMVTQPAGATSGSAFATQPAVELRDAANQVVAQAGTIVTVTKATGTGSLSGTLTATTDAAGKATFTDLVITGTGPHTLSFAAAGLTATTSASFTVGAQPATQLAMVTQPAGAVSGVAFATQPVVELRDATATAVLQAGTVVTVSKASGAGTLSGTLTATSDATGKATFTNLVVTGAGPHTLTFTATGLTATTSASFTVLVPTKVSVVSQPTTAVSGSVFSPPIVAELRDAANTPVLQSGVSITLAIATGGGPLFGTQSGTTDAQGRVSFSNLIVTGIGDHTFGLSSSGLTGAVTAPVSVLSASPTQLMVIQRVPFNVVSSRVFAIYVRVLGAGNGTVTQSGIPITVTKTTGAGTLSGTATALTDATGTAVFSDLMVSAPGTYNLAFASSGLVGTSSGDFVVTAPVATQLATVTQPGGAVSGVALATQPVVELRDAAALPVAQAGVVVTVAKASGTGTLSGTLTATTDVSGRATFTNLVMTGSGPHTLSFTASGVTGATSASFTVALAPASALAVVTQPSGATSGSPFTTQPVIELRNASNQAVLQSGVVVSAAITSGTGTLSGTVSGNTDASGRVTFSNLTISGTGPHTLTFTSAGLTATSSTSFTVAAAPATQLAVVTQPAGAISGSVFGTQPVIELRNASNQQVAQAGTVITVAKASGAGTLSGTLTATTNASGQATFTNLVLTGTGAHTLNFTAAGVTGTVSASFTVASAPATQLAVITQPAGATSGAVFATQPIVELRNASNQPVLQAGVVVTAAKASGAGTLAGTLTATTDVNGRATFTNLSISGTGSHSLSFSAAGLATTTSAAFTVAPAPATQLFVATQPAGAISGAVFATAPAVELRDAASLPVLQAGVTITVSKASGTGTLSGTLSVSTDANGRATFSNLSIAGSGAHTLTFAAAGLSSATSTAFTVTVPTPTQLVITRQPGGAVSGSTLATQPIVELRDAGNALIAQSGVSVSASINSGSGALGGTLTVLTDANGRANFTNLVLTGVGAHTLRFTATGLTGATSASFTVASIPATQLAMITQPSGAVSGQPFGVQPSVALRDAAAQPVLQSGVVVTVAKAGGSGTLSGTLSATTDANGVATFANLTITGTGPHTLTFSSPGLSSATSASFTVGTPPATQLFVLTQPAGAVTGTAFTVQPVIELRDAAALPVTQAGVTITVAKASGTGVLTGPLTAITDANGRATFSGLIITGTGPHTLSFSAAGLTNAVSATFSVASLPATKLAMVAQPAGAVSGAPFTTQPSVDLRDASNALVAQAGVVVTVARASGSGVLSGTLTATTDATGRATFSNLVLTGTGAHTLNFTAPALASVVSASFTVAPQPATQLALVTQPSGATSGTAFAAQPVIELRNAANQAVLASGTIVTAAKATGTGTLSGTLTATTDGNGKATFTDLSITGSGPHSLTFTAAGLTSVTSSSFTVTVGIRPVRILIDGAAGRVLSATKGTVYCMLADGLFQSLCSADITSAEDLAAEGTPISGFTGWTGACTGRALCRVNGTETLEVHATFIPVRSIAAVVAAQDLLTGTGLPLADRELLDKVGNNDGVYNLGDLLAHLERTSQTLPPSLAAKILELPASVSRPIKAPNPVRK